MAAVSGVSLDYLGNIIAEHFNPGDKVKLDIGVDTLPSQVQISQLNTYLLSQGATLIKPATAFLDKKLGPTISLQFEIPQYREGVGFIWWIPLAIVGGLGLIGITAVVGWRMSQVVESLAKWLLPITLGVAALIILPQVIKAWKSPHTPGSAVRTYK